MLLAGSVVQGYRVAGAIRNSWYGITYLAFDLALQRNVELVAFGPEVAADTPDGQERRRFRDHARRAATLDHPALAPVLALIEADEILAVAQARPAGDDLGHDLSQHRGQHLPSSGLPRSDAELHNFLALLIDGLAAIHDLGLVHGAISPESILVTPRHHHPVLLGLPTSEPPMASDPLATAENADSLTERAARLTAARRADIQALAAIGWRLVALSAPEALAAAGSAPESLQLWPPLVTPLGLPMSAHQLGRGRFGDDLLSLIDRGLGLDDQPVPDTIAEWLAPQAAPETAPATSQEAPAGAKATTDASTVTPAAAPGAAGPVEPESPPSPLAAAVTPPAAEPLRPESPLLAEPPAGPPLSPTLPPPLPSSERPAPPLWSTLSYRQPDDPPAPSEPPPPENEERRRTVLWQAAGAGVALVIVLLAFTIRWANAPWAEARATNTVAAYEGYLAQYPRGSHADEARAALGRFAAEVRQRERDQARREEELAWDGIRATRDPNILNAFLARFPSGVYAGEATARRDRLLAGDQEYRREGGLRAAEDKAWTRARNARSAAAIDDFLRQFPDGVHAGEAQVLRDRLAPGGEMAALPPGAVEVPIPRAAPGNRPAQPTGQTAAAAPTPAQLPAVAPPAAPQPPVPAVKSEPPAAVPAAPAANGEIRWHFRLFNHKSQDEDVRPLLKEILEKNDLKVRFEPSVSGTFSFNFDGVPLKSAFQRVMTRLGLSYSYDDKTSTVTIRKQP